MEIFTLLETLEEILENSRSVPFSNKGIVDKEEMLDLINGLKRKDNVYWLKPKKKLMEL